MKRLAPRFLAAVLPLIVFSFAQSAIAAPDLRSARETHAPRNHHHACQDRLGRRLHSSCRTRHPAAHRESAGLLRSPRRHQARRHVRRQLRSLAARLQLERPPGNRRQRRTRRHHQLPRDGRRASQWIRRRIHRHRTHRHRAAHLARRSRAPDRLQLSRPAPHHGQRQSRSSMPTTDAKPTTPTTADAPPAASRDSWKRSASRPTSTASSPATPPISGLIRWPAKSGTASLPARPKPSCRPKSCSFFKSPACRPATRSMAPRTAWSAIPRAATSIPASCSARAPTPPICLTAAQVEAVRKIYSGPMNPRTGKNVYPGLYPGGEVGWGGRGGGAVINRTATSGVSSNDFIELRPVPQSRLEIPQLRFRSRPRANRRKIRGSHQRNRPEPGTVPQAWTQDDLLPRRR